MTAHELLRHYCDLNELPYHSSRDQVVDYLVTNSTSSCVYQTPYGWVFGLIHKYITGDIDVEGVMTSGDMGNAYDNSLASDFTASADCLVYDALLRKAILGSYIITIEIL